MTDAGTGTTVKVIGVLMDTALSRAFVVEPDQNIHEFFRDIEQYLVQSFNEKFQPKAPAEVTTVQIFLGESICTLTLRVINGWLQTQHKPIHSRQHLVLCVCRTLRKPTL